MGYGALLNRFARDKDVHIHIHVEPLQPGAGDPFELVRRAVQRVGDIERRRESFACKALLIDIGEPDKMAAATRLASQAGISHLIWQVPDHEALLLRHFDGCQDHRPPKGESMAALRRRWPEYRKGSSASQLSERIPFESLVRVCAVEARLRDFVIAIGLLSP
ncbi:hypothetical protein CH338_22965 [Rhodoplanes elegans]|uniref:Uncharacterized protein n=1 Tax=Rhodoplanes elegans TaxID=29408 RepID=A0A327K667_9BRAD|nr:hypothetical protein CH338_22965 [Rhodoplanes elegans]